jgi:hypothetical protein
LFEAVGQEDLRGGFWGLLDGGAEVAEGALLEDIAAEKEGCGAEEDCGVS